MGIVVHLQTETGDVLETVEDPTNALHRILPALEDPSYAHLSCIDWYGDTVFNGLQSKRLLVEWRRREDVARQEGALDLHAAIEGMAGRCAADVHMYLKFVGD